MDKYNIDFTAKVKKADEIRLINQIWKLIPMRENDEDWRSHLKILMEEISGLARLYRNKNPSIVLVSKLEGLNSDICEDFMIYRKTVFRCMDLLSKVMSDE